MIKRSKRQEKYSVIDNEVFKSNTLTWEAQGLLSNILSKPDHWTIHPKALVKVTENTRKQSKINSIYTILRELKDAGFVRMDKLNNGLVEYTVFDSPQEVNTTDSSKKPVNDFPEKANPEKENPEEENDHALVSTDSLVSTNKERKVKTLPSNDDAIRIVKFWSDTMKVNPREKRIKDLTKLVNSRLKDYSAKELAAAIKGCSKSAFHMEKKYNSLELILRTSEKIETFMSMSLTANSVAVVLPEDDAKLERWAKANGAPMPKAGDSYTDYRATLESFVRRSEAV